MANSIISGKRSVAGKSVQVDGLDEIQANLAKVINGVTGKQAKAVFYEGGKILRDKARANAPYDPNRKKGTHLRDAIFVDSGDDNQANVLVGVRYKAPGAPHAHLIEYGTVKMAAKPYMRPAIAQTGQQIGSTIKDGLLEVIKNATKK